MQRPTSFRWLTQAGLLVGSLVFGVPAIAQSSFSPAVSEMAEVPREAFVSEASFVMATYQPKAPQRTAASRAQAATSFLEALSPDQRTAAALELTDGERREWTNLPAPANAGGIALGKLKPEQIQKACQLLAELFSDQGYRKLRDIMLADDQLLSGGRPRTGFGTENFSIVLFGTPSETEPWGFQIDGHHVGVNLALQGDKVTLSPSFIGTQPHEFEIAGKKFRPFQLETELAYQLVNGLSDDQIKQAVLGPRRARLVTGPGTDGKVPQPQGLACADLTNEQKALLVRLIYCWVGDLPKSVSSQRIKQVTNELDQLRFSWNGQRKPGSDISYRLQSPTLIIEYVCQDLGGNPIDHLHSMYRNPTDEYGGQMSSAR